MQWVAELSRDGDHPVEAVKEGYKLQERLVGAVLMASDAKIGQGNSGAELALDLIGGIRTQLKKGAVRKICSMELLWRWGTRFDEGGDDA